MCPWSSQKMSDDEILETIQSHEDRAVTAVDLAEVLDLTSTRIAQRLNKLNEAGKVRKKKVGGRAVVWWIEES
jgi:predicted transcriptional regulator